MALTAALQRETAARPPERERKGEEIRYSGKIFAVLKCQVLFGGYCAAVRFVRCRPLGSCRSDFQM
jgi:hypothetical protein